MDDKKVTLNEKKQRFFYEMTQLTDFFTKSNDSAVNDLLWEYIWDSSVAAG